MKKIHRLRLLGRRWWQRSTGNTYHSVEIWVDDNLVHTIPYAYGYGEGYEDSAHRWLEENGYLPDFKHSNGGHEALWRYCERKNIKYDRTAIDVQRKKDL